MWKIMLLEWVIIPVVYVVIAVIGSMGLVWIVLKVIFEELVKWVLSLFPTGR